MLTYWNNQKFVVQQIKNLESVRLFSVQTTTTKYLQAIQPVNEQKTTLGLCEYSLIRLL
uniref:Uncharacterized protein n=1 Tax=Rhizophora mucronata TaxID=61149 RepID=A0A2P2P8Z4_RHIMU